MSSARVGPGSLYYEADKADPSWRASYDVFRRASLTP
jgi:hypothetical protein